MKSRIFGSALLIFGLLITLTPRYILPVCEFYGKPKMACSYMARAELFMGLIILSIAIGAFLSKTPDALRWLMFTALFAGASVIVIPEVLGYCPSPQMPCHYGTVPLLRLLGGLTVITAAVGFVISKPRK
jgi:hypothetical protein